jgi:hypothetical protein
MMRQLRSKVRSWDFPATSNNNSYFPRNHWFTPHSEHVKMSIILGIALSRGCAMFRTPGTCHSPVRHDSELTLELETGSIP